MVNPIKTSAITDKFLITFFYVLTTIHKPYMKAISTDADPTMRRMRRRFQKLLRTNPFLRELKSDPNLAKLWPEVERILFYFFVKGVLFMVEDINLMVEQNPQLKNVKIRTLTKNVRFHAGHKPNPDQSNIYNICYTDPITSDIQSEYSQESGHDFANISKLRGFGGIRTLDILTQND